MDYTIKGEFTPNLVGQAEVIGNEALLLLYGPANISCIAAATVVGKTKVVVSPTVLLAGSTTSIEVTPQVRFEY